MEYRKQAERPCGQGVLPKGGRGSGLIRVNDYSLNHVDGCLSKPILTNKGPPISEALLFY
jgi:hypothetical protein